MKLFLQVVLVCDAIFMITLVLVQNRGASLGSTFGGSSAVNYQRRGGEKFLHYLTIIAAVIFVASAFLILFFK